MSEASNYLENKILDHVLRVASFTQPAALYIALYTVAPTDAGGGTEVSGGGGYARQSISFNASSSGISTSFNAISFPNTSWSGTIVAFGILDALSGGNLLGYSALSPTLSVSSGTLVTAAAGAITVTID